MIFEIVISDKILEEEPELAKYMEGIQALVNRIIYGHYNYGTMTAKYPHSCRAIDCTKQRLDMYEESGNTENCLDAANFAVIEYVCPSHKKAHFKAQTREQSPGLVWRQE